MDPKGRLPAKDIRILIVEDSEDDAFLLLRELERGGYKPASRRVDTMPAMEAALEESSWDVVVSDFSMPCFRGDKALSLVRKKDPDLPFIFVSGTIGEETAVSAMKEGAHDYIMKGNLKRLVPAIEREMGEAEVRRERRRAEERLRASLREKEVLLKEVHHRVKNNLQIICSLIDLQCRRLPGGETREGLQDCRGRVKAMALIHQKLCTSPDMGRVNFTAYAGDLARSVLSAGATAAERVTFETGKEEVFLGMDVAVPCALIVYELVSNALKHAFPGGKPGRISLDVRRKGDRLFLIVADDGVGLPAGMSEREGETLGLQLVRLLAGQVEGSIRWKEGRGTVFEMDCPADEKPSRPTEG